MGAVAVHRRAGELLPAHRRASEQTAPNAWASTAAAPPPLPPELAMALDREQEMGHIADMWVHNPFG